jgi:glycosyltransferase involved in cell wall biosynthesis
MAATLDRTRFEPHVASVIGGFRADELRAIDVPIFQIPIKSFWKPGPVRLAAVLRRYIRENKIQLVHIFDAGLSLVTTLAAWTSPRVRLLSSQRSFMDLVPPKHRYFLLAAHWAAAAIVTNSDALRSHLHSDYHIPLARIDVCHNGLNTLVFTPDVRRRIPELASAPIVIGTVCVMRREKNIGQLLEAFAQFLPEEPKARLLIVGSGPEESNLKQLAGKLRISDACCFLPSTADVRGALRSIDIFVNPSLTEGLPNAVMEAMACGCCVIASDAGGTGELITHKIHGLLMPPGDLARLSSSLRETAAKPEWRREMAEAAVRRMSEEFSLEASAKRMGEIYERRLGIPT